MNGRAAQALEIRIGALVEHESERSVLREIERLLADDGRPAIVFANFEIGSRQIDLLVALDGLALVIEAKGFTRPVCGGENGPWRVHLSSGHWKDFRNPYRQVLYRRLFDDGFPGLFRASEAWISHIVRALPDR